MNTWFVVGGSSVIGFSLILTDSEQEMPGFESGSFMMAMLYELSKGCRCGPLHYSHWPRILQAG